MIDGRRTYAPRADRPQSFFTVVDGAGKVVVPPVALGDQRVMHTSPGRRRGGIRATSEWGVAVERVQRRCSSRARHLRRQVRRPDADRDRWLRRGIEPHGVDRQRVRGARAPAGEARDRALRDRCRRRARDRDPIGARAIEPVLAWSGNAFAVVYRTSKPGTPPQHAQIATDRPAAPSRPQIEVKIPDSHDLWFRTITGGTVGAPVAIASERRPVVRYADDRRRWRAVRDRVGQERARRRLRRSTLRRARRWQRQARRRVSEAPRRRESPRGLRVDRGTGCDLAISYILGDSNQPVRIAVVRAP